MTKPINISCAPRFPAVALSLCSFLLWSSLTPNAAAVTTTWDGGGADDKWSTNNNWDTNAQPGYGTINFAGSTQTVNDMDAAYSTNKLTFAGSSAWTINSSTGAVLGMYDDGGAQAKLENFSTGLATLNVDIRFAASNASPPNPFAEINAVNGDITFGAANMLTVDGASVDGIRLYGSGHTTNFDGTTEASGKYFATVATGTTMAVSGSFTSGDIYLMNLGTLKLNTGGTIITSGAGIPALRMGGDFGTTGAQNLTQGATLELTDLAGGQSFGNPINTVSGNTSGALLVDSQNTSGTNNLGGGIYLDSNLTIQQATGGTLTMTGSPIDLKSKTLTFTGGGNITVSGPMLNSSGTGSVMKTGSGTLTLATANTYKGVTTISAGTVKLGHKNGLGNTLGGTTVNAGGVLDLNGLAVGAEAVTLNGTGIGGTGALINNNINYTAASLSGAVTLASASSVGGTMGNITLSGALTGANDFSKVGSNTVNLTAASSGRTTSAASTQVNGGVLSVQHNTALGTNATANTIPVSVNSGGTLEIKGTGLVLDDGLQLILSNGGTLRTNGSNTINSGLLVPTSVSANAATIATVNATDVLTLGNGVNDITGGNGADDGLFVMGLGTVVLPQASDYVGRWTVISGVLKTSNDTALGTTALGTSVMDGATLDTNGRNLGAEVITITGSGQSNAGAIVNYGSAQTNSLQFLKLSGNATVGGSSRWDLRGAGNSLSTSGNAYSLIKAGVNQITLAGTTVDSALAEITINSGTLSFEDGAGMGAAANTLRVNVGGTLNLKNTTPSYAVSYNKKLVISDSTLNVEDGGADGTVTFSGTTTLTGAPVLNVARAGDDLVFSNVLSGTGSLNKSGPGKVTLTAANTSTGAININGGTLLLSGSGAIADTAVVNLPNSGSSFNIAGITSPSESLASLAGVAGSNVALGAKELILGLDDTSFLYAGDISGTDGSITKVGTGTMTLSGNNTYSKNTNVTSGSLLMGGNNVLPDGAALNLSSGSAFKTGGYSETTGKLTISGPATIDLGSGGSSTISFADASAWTDLLSVWNYTGGASWTLSTGDKLTFAVTGNLDPSKVQFFSDSGTTPVGLRAGFIGNELVPVPEASSVVAAGLLLGVTTRRRRPKH